MRFKPPPPRSSIGWRVEFRSMEVQLTDFENAAFAVFTVLLSRAILSLGLNFYMPISKVFIPLRYSSSHSNSLWTRSMKTCTRPRKEMQLEQRNFISESRYFQKLGALVHLVLCRALVVLSQAPTPVRPSKVWMASTNRKKKSSETASQPLQCRKTVSGTPLLRTSMGSWRWRKYWSERYVFKYALRQKSDRVYRQMISQVCLGSSTCS